MHGQSHPRMDAGASISNAAAPMGGNEVSYHAMVAGVPTVTVLRILP